MSNFSYSNLLVCSYIIFHETSISGFVFNVYVWFLCLVVYVRERERERHYHKPMTSAAETNGPAT